MKLQGICLARTVIRSFTNRLVLMKDTPSWKSVWGQAVAREMVGPTGLVVSMEIDPVTLRFGQANLERAGHRAQDGRAVDPSAESASVCRHRAVLHGARGRGLWRLVAR